MAVRMVYQTAQAVKIPVIGMGGIAAAEDALEFILAGATAVSVGTANFYNPAATVEIIEGDPAVHGGKPGGGYPGTHRSGPVKETAIGQIWRF